ncbi:MAG: protein kinase [Bryobacteraceae bacterium]
MGVVYKAYDTHLGRPVALKVLPPDRVADPDRKRRFVQEAKAASALNDSNIVTIHDIDSSAGVDFIAMEYVQGRTLRETIGPNGLDFDAAIGYATELSAAIAAAHRAGIVHRDLKPAWTASGFRNISPVTRLSNFFGQGPAPAGKHLGMNPHGAFDLAGNVKEWCWNAADAPGRRRYILGGAWNEPVYMFNDPDAQTPISRLATYGFRCVKFLSPVSAQLQSPAETARRDYQREKPAADDAFRIYRSFYAYDKTRLDPAVESTEDSAEHWKLQKVTFHAAYGGERVTAYLYLPRGVEPPYQTIVFFPGSSTLRTRRFGPNTPQVAAQRSASFDFLVRSGRAVLYPVYKSTYERGDGLLSDRPNMTSGFRDHVVQWYKDFARSIDYLETRSDIDSRKIGYYGNSWGSTMGPILLALEDRCRAAVWAIGGFWQQKGPPEVEQINFAPRVKIPVLMLNGKYDFVFPVDTSQAPMFQSLGSPAKDKRHLLFESGHSVPRKELVTETLQWFDRHLGTVK